MLLCMIELQTYSSGSSLLAVMDPWRGHALAYQTAQYALGGLGFKVADGHFKQHSIEYSGKSLMIVHYFVIN